MLYKVYRFSLLPCLLGALLCLPASLAQVQSGALEMITPWNTDFLDAEETALPQAMWENSDLGFVVDTFETLEISALTPAEKALLSRLLRSPAKAPDKIFAEPLLKWRAKFLLELGQNQAASMLYADRARLYKDEADEAVAIDLQMAAGNTQAACYDSLNNAKATPFWARLRVICLTLEDNFTGAELAIEFANVAGVRDPWLARAVFAASGDLPEKPGARYGTGLDLILSEKAGLPVSTTTLIESRLDLAVRLAQNENLALEYRALAAGTASEAGLIDAAAHRQIYQALMDKDGYEPRTPLEVALITNQKSPSDLAGRTRTLKNALDSARRDPARFQAVSRLLMADIKALPVTDITADKALDFAYASLAADNLEEAARWLERESEAPGFSMLMAKAVQFLAMPAPSPEASESVSAALMDSAQEVEQIKSVQQIFTLWSGLGLPLPSPARRFMVEFQDSQVSTPPYHMQALQAAAADGAGAEVITQILALTAGAPQNLHPGDMAQICAALNKLGQANLARNLALEATGYWQADG